MVGLKESASLLKIPNSIYNIKFPLLQASPDVYEERSDNRLIGKPQEIKLAEQLVENLSEEFNLKKYHDEFQDRLKQLIESKQEGREVAAAPEPHRAPVIDMMEALKKSLAPAGVSHKKPMHANTAESHRRGTRRAAS